MNAGFSIAQENADGIEQEHKLDIGGFDSHACYQSDKFGPAFAFLHMMWIRLYGQK